MTCLSPNSLDAEDYVYDSLINLFRDVKLIQGNLALNSSLKRHKVLTSFLIQKQKSIASNIESEYFDSDGRLDVDAVLSKFNS